VLDYLFDNWVVLFEEVCWDCTPCGSSLADFAFVGDCE
jgi:hypothetical protein